MLFILTGNIQTGKTRWLCDACKRVEELGIVPFGVLAPGIWRGAKGGEVAISGGFACEKVARLDWAAMPSIPADANGYEKMGIVNTLLPDRASVLFALRRDVACACGRLEEGSQSEKARLGWHMSDEAIGRVDKHFARALDLGILKAAGKDGARQALLVVDELGRLELMRGEGLVSAMRLLEQGPTEECRHALVVVRASLANRAEGYFADRWGGSLCIAPDDDALGCLLGALRHAQA